MPFFWGIWKFSKNIPAAKSLLTFLCQRSSVEQTVAASKGYDIPPFARLHDFKTWAEEGPPKGTIYNYPPRGDVAGGHPLLRVADQDRQPDLCPGDRDQDDRPVHPTG